MSNVIAMAAFALALALELTPEARAEVVHVPSTLDKSCRNGRAQRYDECSHQIDILLQAMKIARRESKVVLVVYGAEWCIWCHVFSKFIDGEVGALTYTYGSSDDPDAGNTTTIADSDEAALRADAAELEAFVAEKFVVTHIEGQFSEGGDAVLSSTGGDWEMGDGIPFVYALNRKGHFAAKLDDEKVDVSYNWLVSWYRGYDRKRLLAELKRMYSAALAN